MKVTASAPGKLMLMGEHAVVYGAACLVTAVDQRLFVSAEEISGQKNVISAPQVKETRFLEESIAAFRKKCGVKDAVTIETESEFSHNVGLGSSSAVTVATFKALSALFSMSLSRREIFDASYKVVSSIQGVGSGFDVAAATFGGVLYFVKGGKVIDPLNVNRLPLIVGYSGVKADTAALVNRVKHAYKSDRDRIESIFKKISNLVEEGKEVMLAGEHNRLGYLMTKNHSLIRDLDVSTEKLDSMVEVAIGAGAWGAKLSGAGGGDCMIALSPDTKRKGVERAIEEVGGEIIDVEVCAEGVRVE